jgi:hypothetical protein
MAYLVVPCAERFPVFSVDVRANGTGVNAGSSLERPLG